MLFLALFSTTTTTTLCDGHLGSTSLGGLNKRSKTKETTRNLRVMGIWDILQVFVGWAGGLPSKQLKNNSNVKLFICHVIFFRLNLSYLAHNHLPLHAPGVSFGGWIVGTVASALLGCCKCCCGYLCRRCKKAAFPPVQAQHRGAPHNTSG